MNESQGRFCRLYRPIGALLLLLPILFLLLRSCNAPAVVAPSVQPTTAAPTAAPRTAVPTMVQIALPILNVPKAGDVTPEGVTLSGQGQPGTTIELWDGGTRLGSALVGTDGVWKLLATLGAGAHKLAVRTVDASGRVLNELPSMEVVVPAAAVPTATVVVAPTAAPIALPSLNLPGTADFTASGIRLSGSGQPGATVELWDGAIKLGTAVVGGDGEWTLLSQLSAGTHRIAVRTVDTAGKTLNELSATEITIPQAIAMPVLNTPTLGDFAPDGVKLSGTGQPGATLELWEGTTRLGSVVVGADGTWSYGHKLAAGAHRLTVRTVDAAGALINESAAIELVVPATVGPQLGEGQAYIVQPGDWLMKLARRFYNDAGLYTLIVDGTNAKAATDATFATVPDPNVIWVGDKLWIPAEPAAK